MLNIGAFHSSYMEALLINDMDDYMGQNCLLLLLVVVPEAADWGGVVGLDRVRRMEVTFPSWLTPYITVWGLDSHCPAAYQ